MEEINKLVALITRGLRGNYGVIDLVGNGQDPSKEQQLYNGVLRGEYTTDEEAAEGMYKVDVFDQRFRMLKSRVRHKLYDFLYYIDLDLPIFTFTAKVDLECKGYLHKSHLLYHLGEYPMADKHLNRVISLAEENQMNYALVDAYQLKRNILSKECKPTEFDVTINILENLRVVVQAESESEDLFLKVRMQIFKSVHSRNTCKGGVMNAIKKVKELWEIHDSINIYMCLYRLNIWFFLLNEDYLGLKEFAKKSEETVNKRNVNPERFDRGYNSVVAARALLAAERYEEGYKEAEKGLKYLSKSKELWFSLSEVMFLLAIHNKDYAHAKNTLNNVLKNPNYVRSSESTIARWKILRMYLNFTAPLEERLKRVSFAEIHKDSGYYYVEAKGYYISLPILEFIHYVNKNKLDLAESKLNNAENYFFKHLNDPGKNYREKQFYKMIRALKTENYDVGKIRNKTAKYLERLCEKRVYRAFSDFEIIPYENLWEIVLETVAKIKPTTK